MRERHKWHALRAGGALQPRTCSRPLQLTRRSRSLGPPPLIRAFPASSAAFSFAARLFPCTSEAGSCRPGRLRLALLAFPRAGISHPVVHIHMHLSHTLFPASPLPFRACLRMHLLAHAIINQGTSHHLRAKTACLPACLPACPPGRAGGRVGVRAGGQAIPTNPWCIPNFQFLP